MAADDTGPDEDHTPPAEDDERNPLARVAGAAKSAVTGAVGYVQDKRFEKTPAGRARVAFADGAQTFHIRLDLDDVAHRADGRGTRDPRVDDAIGAIEAEGWRLEDLEYVSERDEWEETDENGVVTRGSRAQTFAIMLFRRADPVE